MPREVNKSNRSNYFPYHCRLCHAKEDFLKFKNCLKRCCKSRATILTKDCLIEQPYGLISMFYGRKVSLIVDDKGWEIIFCKNNKNPFSKAHRLFLKEREIIKRTLLVMYNEDTSVTQLHQ